jgi:hypothetical protein
VHTEQLGLIAAVVIDDRNDRLAGEVAREQRDIGLVDVQPDRIDELAPRLLGGVEIAGDVDARGDGADPCALVGR